MTQLIEMLAKDNNLKCLKLIGDLEESTNKVIELTIKLESKRNDQLESVIKERIYKELKNKKS